MNPKQNRLELLFRTLGESALVFAVTVPIMMITAPIVVPLVSMLSAAPDPVLVQRSFFVLPVIWFVGRIGYSTCCQSLKQSRKTRKQHATAYHADVIIHAKGRKSGSTGPIDLEAGLYRLRYRFSKQIPATVTLHPVSDHVPEPLLTLTGLLDSGSRAIMVETNADYVFHIDISSGKTKKWEFKLERL